VGVVCTLLGGAVRIGGGLNKGDSFGTLLLEGDLSLEDSEEELSDEWKEKVTGLGWVVVDVEDPFRPSSASLGT
jgi:hypothetical protein